MKNQTTNLSQKLARTIMMCSLLCITLFSVSTRIVNAQCTFMPGTFTLPVGTTSWNSAAIRNQNVVVPSGATLNITAIQDMAPGVSITVQPNGKINLNTNGELRACNQTWVGVIVNGNAGLSQVATNQGVCTVSGNAIIRNAGVGVKVNAGGMLTTKIARFIDNKVDVEFLPYSIATPPMVTNNVSSFYDTKFLWTQFYSGTTSFLYHVRLNSVYNIHFAGCVFDNTFTGNTNQNIRGIGISSSNASMYCHRLNPTSSGGCSYYTGTKTKFTNLLTAINASSTNATLIRDTRIWQCEFINNDHDIVLDKEIVWRIDQNLFDYNESNALFNPGQTSFIAINENNTGTYPTSIKIYIYANTFNTWNTVITDFIYANKTYSQLEIKKNTFNNTLPVNIGLAYGLKAVDNNSGLKLTCNTYTGYFDRTLFFSGTNPANIGTSALASGNVFPTCAFANTNIFVNGTNINYYYGTGAGQNPGACVVGLVTPISLTGGGQQNTCPNDACTAPPRLAGTTADNSVDDELAISVYPNPAFNTLNILSNNGLRNVKFKILDVMGKEVIARQNFSTDNISIDISFLPNGIYFYEMEGDNIAVKKGKFIKE